MNLPGPASQLLKEDVESLFSTAGVAAFADSDFYLNLKPFGAT